MKFHNQLLKKADQAITDKMNEILRFRNETLKEIKENEMFNHFLETRPNLNGSIITCLSENDLHRSVQFIYITIKQIKDIQDDKKEKEVWDEYGSDLISVVEYLVELYDYANSFMFLKFGKFFDLSTMKPSTDGKKINFETFYKTLEKNVNKLKKEHEKNQNKSTK